LKFPALDIVFDIALDFVSVRLLDRALPPSPMHRPLCAAGIGPPYFHAGFVYRRAQQRRVPQSPAAHRAGTAKSFSPPHQTQVFCVSLQAQYLAFVHFAVAGSTAFSAIAPDRTCL
jgi:hypothetical protein